MKNHRSHISSKRSRARGWRKLPPPKVRSKTRRLGMKQTEVQKC